MAKSMEDSTFCLDDTDHANPGHGRGTFQYGQACPDINSKRK